MPEYSPATIFKVLYARDIPRNTWRLAIGERDKVNFTTEYHHQPRDDGLSEVRC